MQINEIITYKVGDKTFVSKADAETYLKYIAVQDRVKERFEYEIDLLINKITRAISCCSSERSLLYSRQEMHDIIVPFMVNNSGELYEIVHKV